jgi:Carboxypeptidase regulatory-like domain
MSSQNKKLFAVMVCSLVCLVSPLLYGQATGSFSGTVSDTSGAVVSGAKVTVTAQETNVSRVTTTDDSGHFLVPLLGVATYTVRVDAPGFKASESKDVRLQIDEHREVDFKLVPASVSTSVEVNAAEVAVETANPTLGQVITSQQVTELPLNGRDFVQLATLTPGTTQETNPNSFFNGGPSSEVSARGTFSLSVGGSRAQSTDWLFDGNDNNELTAGGIAILPSIDAIQEFKVLTYNYSAEYGTRAGPTVLVTTKSGSNQFHGTLFEFFRNTKLDAKTFDFGTSAPKQQFNLNQFGGSFGGPIKKDKTFFFLDYQAKRQRHGIPFAGLVPTAAMIGGDFTLDPLGLTRGVPQPKYGNKVVFPNLANPYTFKSFQCDSSGNPIAPNPDGSQNAGVACNKIPSALVGQGGMIDPIGQKMMQLYPAPNAVNPSTITNFADSPVRSLNEGEFDGRLDHSFSSKDSIFARFSYDQAVSFVPGGSPGFAEPSPFASTQTITNHGRNAAISETHIFSPNNINQFTFGFNRIFNHIKSFGDATCEAANLGILGADLDSRCANAPPGLSQSTKDCMSCGLSATLVGAYWGLGDRGFAPFQGGTNVFNVSDSFDMIRGKHNIRVGGQIRAMQMNVETNAFQDGFFVNFGFSGDGAADLLLGQMGGSVHDQTFLGATTGRRWKLFRPFVQDDWRVTNNLTLNIGLAWALVTPETEAQNRMANFDARSGKLLVAGTASIAGCSICVRSDSATGVQFDKTAFEPRIGLAWKPLGSQNTAIRAGYAIFHDSSWNQGAQGLWENPPYFAESDNGFSGSVCPFGNSLSATPQNCGLQRYFLPVITSPPNPSTFPGAVQYQNLNFKQGMVQQYNLNIEHQLPGNIVLTAGYAGAFSTHILVDGLDLNLHSPNACGTGGYTFGCGYVTPTNPFFHVVENQDVGRARYNSLQVKAETKSARHGVYALLGYTWARSFDSGFSDGLGSFPGAMYWPLPGAAAKSDWGLSQTNLNNQFTASVIYDLPLGKGKAYGSNWNGVTNAVLGNWQTNVIVKAESGFPLFVIDGSNPSGVPFFWNSATFADRPNLVGDPNKGGPEGGQSNCPASVHTLTAWFNPCAFAHAPTGQLGTASRAPVYGPRFVNTDFSAIKNFPLPFREGMALQFRAEFFNLFNHPHFYLTGNGSLGFMQDIAQPSTFGVVSTTLNDPRVIQFALKLNF